MASTWSSTLLFALAMLGALHQVNADDCVDTYKKCLDSQCCNDDANKCFVKNEYYAQCLETCPDGKGWDCTILTTTTTTALASMHYAVSGSYEGSGTSHKEGVCGFAKQKEERCLDDSTTSVEDDTGDTQKMSTRCCDEDGVGSSPGCHTGTYEEAKATCEGEGLTLCTADQLKAGAGETTGCTFDCALIWSSTSCTSDSEEWDAKLRMPFNAVPVVSGLFIGTVAMLVVVFAALGVKKLAKVNVRTEDAQPYNGVRLVQVSADGELGNTMLE